MSAKKANKQSKPISLRKLLEYNYNFPVIAEVEEDSRDLPRNDSSIGTGNTSSSNTDKNKLEKGELLWLLRSCQDESTGKKAVRVCRFDAPNVEFPVVLTDSLMVHRRSYEDVKDLFDVKAPIMDIGMLANLVNDPQKPVFAVSSDDQENRGERILIHAKEKSKGYLASGKQNYVMIPYNFKGPFIKTMSNSQHKFRTILDIVNAKWLREVKVVNCSVPTNLQVDNIYKNDVLQLKDTTIQRIKNDYNNKDTGIVLFKRLRSDTGRLGDIRVSCNCTGQFTACSSGSGDEMIAQGREFTLKDYKGSFPVTLTYAGSSSDSDYFVSLDDDTLHRESPLIVSGICSYKATYTTLQQKDSSVPPFQSNQMIPDYCPMKVRAASPIPVRIHEMKSFRKPKEAIHVLMSDEYTTLSETFASTTSRFSVQPSRVTSALLDGADSERVRSFPGAVLRPYNDRQRDLLVSTTSNHENGNKPAVFPRRRSRTWTSVDAFQRPHRTYESRTLPTRGHHRPTTSEGDDLCETQRMPDMRNRPVPPIPRRLTKDLTNSLPNLNEANIDDDDYMDMSDLKKLREKFKNGF